MRGSGRSAGRGGTSVYSKLMCWVALDRGLRLANKRSFPADRDRWIRVRDEIYEEIMTRGWSEARRVFVQHYDSDSLDASNLMMPLVFFLSPADPRNLGNLRGHDAPAAWRRADGEQPRLPVQPARDGGRDYTATRAPSTSVRSGLSRH